MLKLTIKLCGSNGSECNQVFDLDCSTQEEIIKIFQEYEGGDYMDFTDHPRILTVSPDYDNPTPEYDSVLDAGGMAQEFISLESESGLITPEPELVKLFS